jgi:hypothetical protein
MKLLLKNVVYYEMEVHPDRLDEIGDWQSVVDLDADFHELEQVSDDYLEYIQVLRTNYDRYTISRLV